MNETIQQLPSLRRLACLCALIFFTGPAHAETWDNPPGKLPSGVEHKTFTSASMKCEVGFNIYLPPAYAADPNRHLPVIYYLHGRGDNESSHLMAFGLLDAAIKAGQVSPVIYVHATADRNSGYVDSPDGAVMGETVVIKELIPHIDATFRTIAKKEGRAVEGFPWAERARCCTPSSFPKCSAP